MRSQKSSIGNCSLEFRLHKINKKDDKGNSIKNEFEKDENGKDIEVKEYLKAIPEIQSVLSGVPFVAMVVQPENIQERR